MLERQLDALPDALVARLVRFGFDRARLVHLAATLPARLAAGNRVAGEVAQPAPGDVADAPSGADAERFAEVGRAALASGQVALAVLAGGMATRMGGVVKALVPVVPGLTFLDARVAEHDLVAARARASVPLWLMSSDATDASLRAALHGRLDGDEIAVFPQQVSLRLERDGSLFRDAQGEASVYATGHGDLPDALAASGLLARFLARGGRWIWIANLDNLGAAIDPALLGWHVAHGAPLTVEVVDKADDRGGIPVRWNGRPVVLEEMRLPAGFDPAIVRTFNTNTLLVDARALAEPSFAWTWIAVEKQVDGRPAIQHERLVNELTSALDTRFVRVPRDGAASRFLPVKDHAELDRRRGDILAALAARGVPVPFAPA